MLCVDGVSVDWPYSSIITTTLNSEQVKALLDKSDAAKRMVAHANLTHGQFRSLYRDKGYRYGRKQRVAGKKLIRLKLETFAEGIKSDNNLFAALKGDDLAKIMGRILALQ